MADNNYYSKHNGDDRRNEPQLPNQNNKLSYDHAEAAALYESTTREAANQYRLQQAALMMNQSYPSASSSLPPSQGYGGGGNYPYPNSTAMASSYQQPYGNGHYSSGGYPTTSPYPPYNSSLSSSISNMMATTQSQMANQAYLAQMMAGSGTSSSSYANLPTAPTSSSYHNLPPTTTSSSMDPLSQLVAAASQQQNITTSSSSSMYNNNNNMIQQALSPEEAMVAAMARLSNHKSKNMVSQLNNSHLSANHLAQNIPYSPGYGNIVSSSNSSYDNISRHNLTPPTITTKGSLLSLSKKLDKNKDAAVNSNNHPITFVIPSDATFLDAVHIFLRCHCLEVIVSTPDDISQPGRGARPTKVGQVGFRCFFCRDMPKRQLTKQAVCYPSKRETIFESVRNFQRTHIFACPCVPQEIKFQYRELSGQSRLQKRSQKYLKAYYAEAAAEIGIVDSTQGVGLTFGSPPNTSDKPFETLQSLMDAAEDPMSSAQFWETYESKKDKSSALRKFEDVATEPTRNIIINARKNETLLVHTSDFPTVSDYDFLIFHQLIPFNPHGITKKGEGKLLTNGRSKGLCCKHCAAQTGDPRKNQFPIDLHTLPDSPFLSKLTNHLTSCPHVPQEIREAFLELKRLADEQGLAAKRGARKRFISSVWERLCIWYMNQARTHNDGLSLEQI